MGDADREQKQNFSVFLNITQYERSQLFKQKCSFSKLFIYLFLEKGKGGEREGEKH